MRSGFAGVVLTIFPAFGFVGVVLALGVVLAFFGAAGDAGASGFAVSFAAGSLSRSSIRLSVTSTASRSSLAASFGLGGALIG